MTSYVVFTRVRTTDPQEFGLYQQQAGAAAAGHPLTPLAFYGKLDILEGEAIEGAVILSFPTHADARNWYDSPAYTAAREHRLKGSDYNIFIIEGVDSDAG